MMPIRTPRRQQRWQLTLVTTGFAPGYRNLSVIAMDQAGNEYELRLSPGDVQHMIFACADVAKQIGDHPPLDWDQFKGTVVWPQVRTWMPAPARTEKTMEVT